MKTKLWCNGESCTWRPVSTVRGQALGNLPQQCGKALSAEPTIFPFMGLMVAFPIILVNKRFREKLLLSPFWLKWSLLVSISSITASLLFIILTNCDLLAGTDITYLARPDRLHRGFYSPTHPYDSMKEIWSMPTFFICEIAIALILYFVGILNKFICRKLSALRRRKCDEMNDRYTEE